MRPGSSKERSANVCGRGGAICTRDLRRMRPTSYYCSTPQRGDHWRRAAWGGAPPNALRLRRSLASLGPWSSVDFVHSGSLRWGEAARAAPRASALGGIRTRTTHAKVSLGNSLPYIAVSSDARCIRNPETTSPGAALPCSRRPQVLLAKQVHAPRFSPYLPSVFRSPVLWLRHGGD